VKPIEIALLIACIGAATPAFAQDCVVTSGGIEFGAYDFTSSAPLDTTGSILVNCPRGLTFRIRMDAGRNSGLSFNPRFMRSAANARIAYNIYIDPSHVSVWGSGDQATEVFRGVGAGVPLQIPVFGRIFAGQPAAPGDYRDSLTIILDW
jgi:spore coat protein U-like protein